MRCFPGRTLVRLLSFELAFSAVAGLPAQTLPPRHQRHGYRSLGAVVSKVAVEVVNTAARLSYQAVTSYPEKEEEIALCRFQPSTE